MEGGESHLLVESHINKSAVCFCFLYNFNHAVSTILSLVIKRSLTLGDLNPYSISGITMLPLMSRKMVFSHEDIE